ncbi:MAG TPA: hypothetical protein VFN67_16910 [Polyangiales bacterium]|nr:hypothetical protein [Polyangiales bacterium]
MQVAKPEGMLHRRSLRPISFIALSLFTACSSSPPPDESQAQMGVPSSTPTANTGKKPTSGGTATVDAGTSSGGRGNMTTTGNQSGSSGSSTKDMDAGTKSSTTAGSGGMSSMMVAAGASGAVKAGAGGKAASEGEAGASGNQAGMGADEDDAGAPMCIPLEKPLNTNFAKCSMELCPAQDSVCVPTRALKTLKLSDASINLLADCNDMEKCVPEFLANRSGRVLLTTCKSINDAEGRCLSPCVPSVAAQASQLPKDVCQGTDLCAPCFDPRTGAETGACDQGCDTGPKEPPKLFTKCCSDRGLCVPPALAGDQAKNLDRSTCSEGTLCAPSELTDPTFHAKSCDSIDGAEGRCISTCVGGAIAKQKDRLPTAGCDINQVCAPCFDPVTGEDTGACSVNGDKPAKPKQVFDHCCGMSGTDPVGVCVPPALAGAQASILRQEGCAAGKLCAPVKKAQDPAFKFATCNSLLGRGACVHSCIVDPNQAAILTRSGCEMDELCAPCDLLGTPTNACL